jgi:ubiquinone/menaquinone biosynthesis C-methylase UbiE
MTNVRNSYNRIARFYDILTWPFEKTLSGWRKQLLQDAEGRVLEVGIGTGNSLSDYPEGLSVTGVDISERMIDVARKKTKGNHGVELMVMDTEALDFEDDSFDTVVSSCVFCAVPDAVQGLKEIRRVCRPGGKVLMLEHVRSRRKTMGKIMDWLNPLTRGIMAENINRQTFNNLVKAGFQPENISVESVWFDIVKLFRISN